MKNKILLIILIIFLLTGCTKKQTNKIKLEDKYYGNSEFIEVKLEDIEEYIDNKESFVLFTYNYYCNMPIPVKDIFEKYMVNKKVSFVSIPFEEYKKLKLDGNIKYAPSIIIFDKGKIIAYLDAESNKDLPKFQNVDKFTNWIENYIEYK